jgi:RimJ/RimL family protein N-acetyltransferase
MTGLEDLLEQRFPKELELKNLKLTVRPMVREDVDKLYEFFCAIPKQDILYLLDDVRNRRIVETWCETLNYNRILPLLACVGDKVVGDATLHQEDHGWKNHIAHVRIAIHPDFRHQGLATLMVGEIIEIARDIGLAKLDAEFMSEQEAPITVFERLGFIKMASLPQHVRDIHGKAHDLVILVHDLRDQEYFAAD